MKNPIITLKKVAMLLPFISTEETRYYLQGFYLEPHKQGGVILAATNGRTIGITYDEKGTAEKPIIWKPSRIMVAACKSYTSETTATYDDFGPETVTKIPEDGEMAELVSPLMGDSIDGTFPDFRKVISEIEDKEADSLGFELLQQFSEVGKFLGDVTMTIRSTGQTNESGFGPRYVSAEQDDSFFGLIMPRKPINKKISIPNWLIVK
jgi:hypothetical protein